MFHRGVPFVAAIAGRASASASQQILSLAESDGWTAVYDPTNPDTRTLRESGGNNFIAGIEDGLGNLTELVQATEANQFQLLPSEFSDLDGMQGTATTYLKTTFASALAQPMTIVSVGEIKIDGTKFFYDGITSSNRMAQFRDGSTGTHRIYSGMSLATTQSDADPHVFASLFNGASSVSRIDSTQRASGDAGTNTLTGLTVGQSNALAGGHTGRMSVIVLGDVTTAARGRMEDLLHTLSGIAKA